jgi:glycosyltransferase involved in cell wall biosynthesis
MVSVIIPAYNRVQYIKGCLNSVLNQTYKDYEIIVVDDGSTDNTKEVLTFHGNKIRYIYQENKGEAGARNEGIRNTKGDYIAWLDSDDRWLDFKLDLQIKIFEKIKETTIKIGKNDYEYYKNHKKLVDRRISHYLYSLGLVYYRKGKIREALSNFLKSLSLNLNQKKIYIFVIIFLFTILISNFINLITVFFE